MYESTFISLQMRCLMRHQYRLGRQDQLRKLVRMLQTPQILSGIAEGWSYNSGTVPLVHIRAHFPHASVVTTRDNPRKLSHYTPLSLKIDVNTPNVPHLVFLQRRLSDFDAMTDQLADSIPYIIYRITPSR